LLPYLRYAIFLDEIEQRAGLGVEHLHNELKRKGCKTKAFFNSRMKAFPGLKSAVLRQWQSHYHKPSDQKARSAMSNQTKVPGDK
jgi:hypothetical protein